MRSIRTLAKESQNPLTSKPDGAAEWTMRFQLTFPFPKPPSVPRED